MKALIFTAAVVALGSAAELMDIGGRGNQTNSSITISMNAQATINQTVQNHQTKVTAKYDLGQNITLTANSIPSIWDKFTNGTMEYLKVNYNGGNFMWWSANETSIPWNWTDSPLYEYLNSTYYQDINITFDLDSSSPLTFVYFTCYTYTHPCDNQSLALAASVWNSIIHDGNINTDGPVAVYPSQGSMEAEYYYTTNLTKPGQENYIDFIVEANNVTDDQSVAYNATVTFASQTPFTENETQAIWDQFLLGNWQPNVTYYDNGTTALRFWNFTEQSPTEPSYVEPNVTLWFVILQNCTGYTSTGYDSNAVGNEVTFTYAKDAPIGAVWDEAASLWDNFTGGFPSNWESFPTYAQFRWNYDYGSSWSYQDNSRVQEYLPEVWPQNFSVSWYGSYVSMSNSSGVAVLDGSTGSEDVFTSNESLAVMQKTWDGFIHEGFFTEPILWFPFQQFFALNYTYDVTLAHSNVTKINFNATSNDTNANWNNQAPVFFSSDKDATNYESPQVQSIVAQIWQEFLNGTWSGHMNFSSNDTVGKRTWMFDEQSSFKDQ